MKIVVDVRLLSKGGTTGIEEYTKKLLKAIFEIDSQNKYLLFYNGLRKAAFPPELLRFPNVKLVDWKIPNKIFGFLSRFGYPKIDKVFGAEAVFSPHFNVLAVSRARRVVTIHDLSFLRFSEFFSCRRRFWHWLQNVGGQIRDASKIIAVSEFTRNDVIDFFGVPGEKVVTIYSGVDLNFKKTDAGPWEKLKPFVLYLGTIEPRKNVAAVIKAFEIIKESGFRDLNLVLAGGWGWLFGNVIKAARRSSYSKNIFFIGRVSEEERLGLYSAAEIFLYPSFFEGFGFQPLEAQTCGLPVVVSNRSSLPELVGGSALMVDPLKSEELAAAAKAILGDGKLKEALIKLGLENVKRFSWRRAARETLKVLTQ